MNKKQIRRHKRKQKIRSKISGTKETPRLSVYRSNAHIYAQLIDDSAQKTLGQSNDLKMKGSKTDNAKKVGEEIAGIAKKLKVKNIVFDRNGYIYHGRVKNLADSVREQGVEF